MGTAARMANDLDFGPEYGGRRVRYAVAVDGALYVVLPVFMGSGPGFHLAGWRWFLEGDAQNYRDRYGETRQPAGTDWSPAQATTIWWATEHDRARRAIAARAPTKGA